MSSNKRLPPSKSIEAFVVAARSQSFTEAAAALNITVAAMSRRIQALEQELGVQLFQRSHHTLTLNEHGRSYVSEIMPALEIIRAASERLRVTAHRRSIRVSLPPSFAASWLIPRLSRFQAEHRGIDVELESAIGEIDLDRSDIDLAIRLGSGNWPGQRAKRLLDVEAYPVCSPSLLRENTSLAGPKHLVRFPLLGSKTRPELWRNWLQAAGIDEEPPVKYLFDNFHMLYRAASDGLGVALGLDVIVNPYLDEGRLIRLFDVSFTLPNGIYVVCRKVDRTRRPVCTFRDWLVAEAAAWRSEHREHGEQSFSRRDCSA
jgi:LysR family glycine cleavage system transcriptional activator